MGSWARVFQTAPPQPASNARRTWYSELVGGPDANQNGLGALIPQNSMERSGITVWAPFSSSMRGHHRGDSPRSDFSILYGIDDFPAVAQTVAASEEPGHTRSSRGAFDDDLPIVDL